MSSKNNHYLQLCIDKVANDSSGSMSLFAVNSAGKVLWSF